MTPPSSVRRQDLADWLCATVATASRRLPEEVTLASEVWRIGLDSLTLVAVVTQAEAQFGLRATVDDVAEILHAARMTDLLAVLDRCVGEHSDSPP